MDKPGKIFVFVPELETPLVELTTWQVICMAVSVLLYKAWFLWVGLGGAIAYYAIRVHEEHTSLYVVLFALLAVVLIGAGIFGFIMRFVWK